LEVSATADGFAAVCADGSTLYAVSGGKLYNLGRLLSDGTLGGEFSELCECEDVFGFSDGVLYYVTADGIVRHGADGTAETVVKESGILGFDLESKKWWKRNPDYFPLDRTETDKLLFGTIDVNPGTEIASASVPAYLSTTAKVTVGSFTLPFSDYPLGSYFSKNRQPCTCHPGKPNIDCVATLSNCNCMRYWPTGVASTCTVDLRASQCYGFARFCFWRLFGFLDTYENSSKYHNEGTLAAGAVTANAVKAIISRTKAGAHIRVAGLHSLVVLSVSDSGFVSYECNYGYSGPCMIYSRSFTWASFASEYNAYGIEFVHMPNQYPAQNGGGTVIVRGDINGDGRLNVLDLLSMLLYFLTNSKYIEKYDVNNDYKLSFNDIEYLRDMIVGKV